MKRILATVLLGTMTLGCVSVRPVRAPATYVPAVHPSEIWVSSENGEVLRLVGPSVRGDSLVGMMDGLPDPVAVPITPQEPVYAMQKDPLKTATLVGSFGLVAGLVVYGFAKGANGPEDCVSQGANPTGRPYC